MKNNNKEIIYIGDVGRPNTALAIHAQNMARLFWKLGYHTTFICDAYKDIDRISDEMDKFDYFYTKMHIKIPKISAIEWLIHELTGCKYKKLLKEKIARKKPNFVVIYGYAGESWITNYCHKKNIPVIIERVDWFEKTDRTGFIEKELIQRQVDKAILKKDKYVDGIISISRFFENYYQKMKVPTIFIPPIFQLEHKNTSITNDESKHFRLVYSGSIGGKKDSIFPVLQAIKNINSKKINIFLDIIGPTLEQVQIMTKERDWKRYGVEVHGRISNDEVKKIIRKADFSLLLRENKRYAKAGFSTKFAESMCLGVPVICTKVGGSDSVITHMYDGVLIDDNNVSTIVDILSTLLNKSQDDLNLMKKNAFAKANKIFNINSYVDELNIFLNAIEEQYE